MKKKYEWVEKSISSYYYEKDTGKNMQTLRWYSEALTRELALLREEVEALRRERSGGQS